MINLKEDQHLGKIGSGVSKITTHLIMKAVGSGSSKEKAMELGVKIMTVEQLEDLLKYEI
jgi:NAD-dependent DNA ligase